MRTAHAEGIGVEHHQRVLRTTNPCPVLMVTSCQWLCRLEPRRAQVLSDSMVLTEDDGGLCLMARVGDTFPNQILDPIVRAYLYRWPGSVHNPGPDYTVRTLDRCEAAYGCYVPSCGVLARFCVHHTRCCRISQIMQLALVCPAQHLV